MSRTYPMEPLRQKLFLFAGAVLAAFGVTWPLISFAVLGDLNFGFLDLVVVGLPTVSFLALGLFVALASRSIRLELKAEGIALLLPGGALEADWADVDTIAPAPWGPLSGESLILRRPLRGRRPWWLRILGSRGMERSLPLSPFALPLRGSRLEADLRSRLPDLFD